MKELNIYKTGSHMLHTRCGEFEFHSYEWGSDSSRQAIVLQNHSNSITTPPLLRVQFSCLYGEAFRSIDCDCKEQLDLALSLIKQTHGILIYFPGTDARGLGLKTKIALTAVEQSFGLTPLEACRRTKTPYSRFDRFDAVPYILKDRRVGESVRLLSNSPQKLAELIKRGVRIESVRHLAADTSSLSIAAKRELHEKHEVFNHEISNVSITHRTEKRNGYDDITATSGDLE